MSLKKAATPEPNRTAIDSNYASSSVRFRTMVVRTGAYET
jgi:hypothetical protein